MNGKVAIIGPREQILGFGALGVSLFPAKSMTEARDLLFRFRKDRQEKSEARYAILFVLEDYLRDMLSEDYAKLSADPLPAIIPLPGMAGATGFGNEKIRRIVEKAVGSDIFGDK